MPKLLKKRGGARPGSGQKPIGDSRRIIKTIALEQKLWDAIEAYRTQAGLSRNGAVHKLLSECLLSERTPGVQKPLIDTPAPSYEDIETMTTGIDKITGPAIPLCLEEVLNYTHAQFGQWLAGEPCIMTYEEREPFKAPWRTADPNTLNGFRQYGPELIGAIKAGRLKLHPDQARGIGKMDDRGLRKALITLAEITF